MSGFSAEWLALREPVDARSRNPELAAALAKWLAGRTRPNITDLGCGTGSNLRALAPQLGPEQRWQLVDYDSALLAAAAKSLASWADTSRPTTTGLDLVKAGRHIEVSFQKADLRHELPALLSAPVDLVTASALFDLFSPRAIDELANNVATTNAAFYTVLTYDGCLEWQPPAPQDAVIRDAFNTHQRRDKGLGAAAGPMAPKSLADAFRRVGYQVREATSPWLLSEADNDNALMSAVIAGVFEAVRELGELSEPEFESWRDRNPTAAIVGHVDTLALPAASAPTN